MSKIYEQYLKLKEKIEKYLKENLKLNLNEKSSDYINYKGINFCGYRIFETHILFRKRFKKKINKQIILWNKLIKENKINKKRMYLSLNSYKAHASHCNSYNYMTKIEKKILKALKEFRENL